MSSLPWPGTASVALMCCSVSLFIFLGNWWPCWSRGLGPDVLQRSLQTSTSLWFCDVPVMYRDSSYSDPDPPTQPGRQVSCFSSTFSVLFSRSLLRTLLAVSILPSVHVPQCTQESWSPGTQPGWAENPRHVTSSFWSFVQMHLIRSMECG